mmetsp:Transcript_35751/g.40182  ORF Transcript_35751/g.40182 Transcript_35751/m.40182 type:complete len:92 (+) Transcript_35751:221-496(+)
MNLTIKMIMILIMIGTKYILTGSMKIGHPHAARELFDSLDIQGTERRRFLTREKKEKVIVIKSYIGIIIIIIIEVTTEGVFCFDPSSNNFR